MCMFVSSSCSLPRSGHDPAVLASCVTDATGRLSAGRPGSGPRRTGTLPWSCTTCAPRSRRWSRAARRGAKPRAVQAPPRWRLSRLGVVSPRWWRVRLGDSRAAVEVLFLAASRGPVLMLAEPLLNDPQIARQNCPHRSRHWPPWSCPARRRKSPAATRPVPFDRNVNKVVERGCPAGQSQPTRRWNRTMSATMSGKWGKVASTDRPSTGLAGGPVLAVPGGCLGERSRTAGIRQVDKSLFR
jgi:hypothetical protein